MLKFVIVGTIAAVASAGASFHPVSKEMVEEIKARATTWVPFEVEENPLKDVPLENLIGLLGTKV